MTREVFGIVFIPVLMRAVHALRRIGAWQPELCSLGWTSDLFSQVPGHGENKSNFVEVTTNRTIKTIKI
jgi:hypothetical protein